MPSTYAHYQFGEDLRLKLNRHQQQIIHQYPNLYHLGLHGPDILFYFRPLKKNDITKLGNTMHNQSAHIFFNHAIQTIQTLDNKEMGMAYLYGYLAHFSLDTTCHNYINRYEQEFDVLHSDIEGAFEKAMMIKCGHNPLSYPTKKCLDSTKKERYLVASFYPSVSSKQINESIIEMRFYHAILTCPGKLKRTLICNFLKTINQYKSLKGHIISLEDEEIFQESNNHLCELYDHAFDIASTLFNLIDDDLKNGKVSHPYYLRTFDLNETDL